MKRQARTTIAERIRTRFAALTPAERQLADSLMANYPVAGLSSITDFARTAGVSTPTVLRAAKKLGFSGFPEFQAALRDEIQETLATPIARHDVWVADSAGEHILNRFAQVSLANLRTSLRGIDAREFDAVARLLMDPKRRIHIIGGRISHSLASYLCTHLQMARDGVSLMPRVAGLWPQQLIAMNRADVLVVFDVRRYEAELADLALLAREQGATIVLFTDQWMSPVAAHARHAFAARVEVPSSWDSGVVILFLVEALIAAAVDAGWPQMSTRMTRLEQLLDRTRRFRRSP